jgi:hypothetical protein
VTAALVPVLPDLYDVPEDEEARKAWRIDGLGTATWAMEKALDVAMQQKEITEVVEQRVEQLKAWAAAEIEKLQGRRDFFEGALKHYALTMREQDPKRNKSVVTPFGTVATTVGREKWSVADETAALDALRGTRPELVVTKESLALGEAKKVLESTDDGEVIDAETGLVVPGITVEVGPTTARVKLDGFA